MRVWNSLSFLAGVGILIAVQTQAKELSTDAIPSSGAPEGRSLFKTGIFRKISEFFGFGGNNRKMTRQSSPFRRPEMLPFELLPSSNRRSDGPGVIRRDFGNRKYGPKQRESPHVVMYRGKRPVLKAVSTNRISSSEPVLSYEPINNLELEPLKRFEKDTNDFYNDNFVEKDLKTSARNILNTEPYTKVVSYPAVAKQAKSDSLKYNLSYFKSKDQEQIPTTNMKLEKKSKPHSKFALTNYASKPNSRPGNHFLKDPLSNKKINTFKQGTQNPYLGKGTKPYLKNGFIHQKKKEAHPYPFDMPNKPQQKQQQPHKNHRDKDPLIAQGHGPEPIYAAPFRGEIVRPFQKEKQKGGLLQNVSSLASNFFGNFLPKSSKSSTMRPVRRRNRNSLLRNPDQSFIRSTFPYDQSFIRSTFPSDKSLKRNTFPSDKSLIRNTLPSDKSFQRSSSSHLSTSTSTRKDINSIGGGRFFDPSPQQGTIATNSFQPIFVPSHSMDSKLPSDIMKPLIVPQNRKAQIHDPTPNKPELMDFF